MPTAAMLSSLSPPLPLPSPPPPELKLEIGGEEVGVGVGVEAAIIGRSNCNPDRKPVKLKLDSVS